MRFEQSARLACVLNQSWDYKFYAPNIENHFNFTKKNSIFCFL